MTTKQVHSLLLNGVFPAAANKRELIETHISWVIICDEYVYKIKKSLKYPFLDFSTLEQRKHFCEREIELNKRLTESIYIDVQPVRESKDHLSIGGEEGIIIDYAVRMKKQDRNKQLDILLSNDEVTLADIKRLAKKIAFFHKEAQVIFEKDLQSLQQEFNDLRSQKKFLSNKLDIDTDNIISSAINSSDAFLKNNGHLLAARLRSGFYRDCHGDLHTRNIFLLPSPQPFDCIEFNDDFRQIDVLNEVAFLCMDLDAFGRKDLSEYFISSYTEIFQIMKTGEDRHLFIYYKAYRANVRAKVNSLRARSTAEPAAKSKALCEVKKYLKLMEGYLEQIK